MILNQVMRRNVRFAINWIGQHKIVDLFVVLISAWLFIGYAVSQLEKGKEGATIQTIGDGLWWGVVTLTTVGYGDRYPVTTVGRIFGVVLMLSGLLSAGIVTAKISTIFLEETLMKDKGMLDQKNLNDHFVICGWKDDMADLLLHVIAFNEGLSSDQLVVVAPIGEEMIASLHAHEKLRAIRIVKGEPHQEVHLRRAAPQHAKKILILADRSPTADGHFPSAQEADARTIMTAITLSNLARNVLVTAEILDPKLDHFLKSAGVSEIIYSREYSRLMLGTASGGTGLSNVLYDLLDPKASASIRTEMIDGKSFGVSYAEFRQRFDVKNPDSQLIGILENIGSPHILRDQAMKEAQRTPNIERMIQNIQAAKNLRCNHPVFHPTADYVIPPGSAAIFITTSHEQEHAEQLRTAA